MTDEKRRSGPGGRGQDNKRQGQGPKRPPKSQGGGPRRPERDGSDGDEIEESYIEGRNAVSEALKAGRTLNKVFIAAGDTDAGLRRLTAMARDAGAVVVEVDRRKLDSLSVTGAHQGIVALAAVKEYCTVRDILDCARERGEAPLIVICDEVSDGHNLGAVIRTGECAGAHGVIIPKRRSASLTAVVSKTSAGAVEYMRVARVPNLASAIRELQDAGVWIYGTAADAERSVFETDLTGPVALVIGSEGDGMRKLTAESCDFALSIPMKGHISSLNASTSAAIVLYEAVRQRTVGK